MPIGKGRRAANRKDAQAGSGKKSPSRSTIGALCVLWAGKEAPITHRGLVAREVATELGHLRPEELRSMMLDTMLNRWRTHYAKWTAYTRQGILKQLLRRLAEHGAPVIRLQHAKMPPVRPTIAKPEEIAAALAHAEPFERLLILLCWQTALRSSAALHASTSNWNREEHTIAVIEKGGVTRTVPLTPEIEELLHVADRTAEPAGSAVMALRGKKLSRAAMNMVWWRLKKKAGLNEDLRLHDLRRTALTNLYINTRDLRAVQRYAGHESLMSTIRYIAPLSEGQLRGLQESLYYAKPTTEVKQ